MANDHVKMFAEEYGPIAEQVSKKTGIAPSLLLAQWGMESKYGRSPVGQFNFGNIKDLSGTGNEGVDNKTKSKDKYLNFESPEAFGDYYANLMRRLYPKALNTGTDITKYTEGLRNGVIGSYFEDPNYEDAIRGAYKVTSNFYSDAGGDSKEANPNNPFAVGVPLADKARESATTEEITPTEPTTLLEKASALANEINPATAAAFGAVANVAGAQFVKPPLTPAEISSQTAQKKLELERANLNKATSYSQAEIEDIYKQSQGELDRVKNEQRLAKARLEGLPKAPPAMEMPEAPAAFDEPSRTKSGASGAVNYVNAMSDNVPEVLANQALNMRKDNPRGGQAIIDANTLAIQKQADLGMGDYGLTRTASGVQLALPPTTVAERQADIDKQNQANQAELEQRAEQTRIQQEAQAQQFEQQRLAHEAEVERLRQERATIGSQHNQYASELKDIKPLQKAVTQAEKAVELAKYNAKLKAQNQPITPQYLLNKGMAVSRPLVGGLAGAAGVMSLQEALERFKAGDTSEGVLKIIQASSAAAMLTPPLNKTLSRTRKTGALGAIGSYGYDFARRFLKDSPEE